MIVLRLEVLHEVFGRLAVAVSRPHRGDIHIVSCRSCDLEELGRNEAVIPEDRLIHSHFSHLLQDESAFLIVTGNDDRIRIHIVDLRQLCGEVRILIRESFRRDDVHALRFERLHESLVGRYLMLVVVRVEDSHILITEELVRFLHGLRDILRLRHAVSEHVVADLDEAFCGGRYAEERDLCLLEERADRFVFTGDQGADDQHLLGSDHLLRRTHALLHIALRIRHFDIEVDLAFLIHFLDRQVKAFLLRKTIRSDAARHTIQEAHLCDLRACCRLRSAFLIAIAAASCQACHRSCQHQSKSCSFHHFFHFHF